MAVGLLRGDFLEGFDVDGAPAFEDWSAERRTYYRARAVTALLAAGEEALVAGRYGDAVAAAGRALALQPYAEPALTLWMRAAALAGDAVGALAAFRDFGERIAADIGERPSPALAGLAERIRARRWRSPRPGAAEQEPALVGRESLHRAVFGALADGLRQGPRVLLVTGDPGTGKTRLLRECMDRLALQGAVIGVTRPLESDQDAPWSTCGRCWAGACSRHRAAPPPIRARWTCCAAWCPSSRRQAAGVYRAMRPRWPRPCAPCCEPWRTSSPWAWESTTRNTATGRVSMPSARRSRTSLGAPVVAVLTATPAWDQVPQALVRLRGELGRSLPGLEVRLEPFSETETRALVWEQSRWCTDDAERDRLARRVFFETSGNPFLVTTLLRGLADASALRAEVLAWPPPGETADSPLPISVPHLARRAITARVARLDDQARRVRQAASIRGAAIDVELVAALTELPRAAVEDALGALERARLVAFVGDRYAVAAPLVAQVVMTEWLLPGERRVWRERAIGALASRSDIEARLLRAQLAAVVAPGSAAFDAAMDVAHAALAPSAPRTVRQALGAAARALPPDDEARRLVLAQFQAVVSSETA